MIDAKIIADSQHPHGQRITTMQLIYPRYIHAEFMTHRMFSRNASSSRAVPVSRTIEEVLTSPVIPMHWGRNQAGMQAREEVPAEDQSLARMHWLDARDQAVASAKRLLDLGIHKQVVNRLLEPFQHIKVVCTATDWANFYNLRCHPDAMPEIQALANAMLAAQEASIPRNSAFGEWHLPYVTEAERLAFTKELCRQLSVARCARVSYKLHDGSNTDIDKDVDLHDKLSKAVPPHYSPFEHQACPGSVNSRYANFRGWISYRYIREFNLDPERV